MNRVRTAIQALQQGQPVVCLIQGKKHTQGVLVLSAENATPHGINFLAREGRGLICAGISSEIAHQLDLQPMVACPESPETERSFYTISVDAQAGITTGISAPDRALTVRLLADPSTRPDDLVRPGHIFPQVTHRHGILGRNGAAEAAADLARLAGFASVGAYSAVLDADGHLADEAAVQDLARRTETPLIRMDELIRYRLLTETFIRRVAVETVQAEAGTFQLITYYDRLHEQTHYAMQSVPESQGSPFPLVHIHRACVRGDVFGAQACDCGTNLKSAMALSAAEGGVILYIGERTVPALRTGAVAAHILTDLSVTTLRLYRPWDGAIELLGEAGIAVLEQVADVYDGCPFDVRKEAMSLSD